MEKHLYICEFCQKEFEPTRRKVQKFCSATCRSKNHHHKNKMTNSTSKPVLSDTLNEPKKNTIEKISISGVGNAALGTLAANTATAFAKEIFATENNKPATKKDIQELKDLINTRYFEVNNMSTDAFGNKPYFDLSTNKIVYYNEQLQRFELPFMDV
ncbi:MAG: hypothetical protein HKP59_09165 [Lutibacter sp.]|uniref:hypothetical protein n=1 Tax=Lutibacter sp. TaxID=1925666 RepID=UPI0017CA409A|nr:hypothetical protein [Lutibacter sp.]MBT8317787.1 hypothetical protein [Lutibacter sp.]NNJ58645.1 hypothetical protein [Lutibacter sp.]